MLNRSRRSLLVLLALTASTVACDDAAQSSDAARTSAATVASAPVLPPFQQEIGSANAEVTLPGVWKYGYWLVDKADTTNGAYRAIEFLYVGDSVAKVPPRLLLVIRAFKKPVWERLDAKQRATSTKLAERVDAVYAFSIVTTNPYRMNTPAALRVDAMMLALIADGSPFKIRFK